MTISFDQFAGLQPRLDPTSLGDTQATVARNCRLHTLKLNPIRNPLDVTAYPIHVEGGLADVAGAKTLALWRRGKDYRDFLAWAGDVHVAPSNILADTRYRVFVTGETHIGTDDAANQPCAFISSEDGRSYDRHLLFVESPLPPIVSRNSTGDIDSANERYTVFYQTYVDGYGYESAASLPSEEVTYNDGDLISWGQDFEFNADGITRSTTVATPPDGVVARRLYKAVAGGDTATAIKFVAEQSLGNGAEFGADNTIKVKDEDTGEVLPSITAIPKDLDWMTAVPGNFYAGFLRSEPRRICFSDVDLPTSWPDAYRYDIRDGAIGMAVAGNTVFVLTKGYPWAISGSAPEGMTAAQIVSEQACVSARSICTLEGRVFYASQDGVCVLSESSLNSTVVTRAYWDKTGWSKLNPSSCVMRGYDNALFLWFTLEDGTRDNYIIDFDTGGNPIITQHDDYANAVCVDCDNDALYYVKGV